MSGRLRTLLPLLALLFLGAIASGTGTGSIVFPLLAAASLALLGLIVLDTRTDAPTSSVRLWVAVIVAGGVASPYLLGTTYWSIALMVAVSGLIAALFVRTPRTHSIALVGFPVVAAIILLIAMPGETIDVWFLHREAGTALTEGGNPYADLRVPNGAPDASDPFITGYPYPPVPLVTYGITSSVIGESRWVTIVAWIAVAAAFASAGRSSERVRLLGWALVAHPSWALMLWSGWTEPLSVSLIVVAWAVWHRHRVRDGTLAVALASKQYFVIVGAVVAATRSLSARAKVFVIGGATLLTVPAAVWGVADVFDAMVGLHTRQPYRPDGSTLYALLNHLGLEVRIPSAIGLAAGIVIALWIGRRSDDRRSQHLASATALTAFFFLGSQAFANYWFVVFAYLICALATPPNSVDADQDAIRSEAPNP